jgi:hypothetical protein
MNEQQGQGSGESKDGEILHSVQDESREGHQVVITHEARREMTARGAAGIGATIAGILGAVFFASYSVTGGVFCSGLPRQDCPSSWVPYAIVSTVGFVVVTLLGAFAGWAFFRLYQMLRVD